MRDLHDRGAFAVELLEELHDFLALSECRLPVGSSARISFGSEMIGARDADELLLSAESWRG
jgi:hypothetical protein